MGLIGDFLRRLAGRTAEPSEADVERLRIAFKARYQSFRLLLEANRHALEIMTELEQMLRGPRPFGMTYVRARSTRVATHVWQMIRHLDELAPSRYSELFERFREIRARIEPYLGKPSRDEAGELVLPLNEINAADVEEVGAKMANLGEMRNRIGLRVPEGFVVTAHGFRRFLEHGDLREEIDRRLQLAGDEDPDRLPATCSEIQQLIVRATLPPELERAILEGYRQLELRRGGGVPVAVRSSALDEDLASASVAGQYRSDLNVGKDALLDAYRHVVASVYGLPAMTYRVARGLRHEDVTMCVGVLTMVNALCGGVLYSRNPVDSADPAVIINSAWGLPMPVVEGRIPSDLFVVTRDEPFEIRRREIRGKPMRFDCSVEEGVCSMHNTGDERSKPSLDDGLIRELARLALHLEQHYGLPQDVEWAVDQSGTIHLLQSRPLQVQRRRLPATSSPNVEGGGEVLASGGITASSGAAAGPVFVVKKETDALRFPAGSVLVTIQALPVWASVLGRASAIVAEHGSVAGHLANVAREYGIPALFSVAEAVNRLSGEAEVTVDADARVVYRGRVEALLAEREPVPNPMEGTPVYQALQGAAQHIVPLNLLNPDDAAFKPEGCETLHDITRFCHEKAVQEMFRFGKDHHFPQRSSKQLFTDVPMQWWVLNLDDGFREEVEGRYIRLDNIVSRPMIALWEGIVAVPWEGPPPLDGRGFLAVMFGATTNAALTPGLRSQYADRNYFMVSRDYCSLSSRLGAHFSIVEAMVGDRTSENYVSFQFKGGAADFERRLRRVFFVREILEEYGFRTALNEDNLIARLEGREASFMLQRLKVLGYLTIHTRQLDMVMSRPAAVDHYRKKITAEIDRMLGKLR
jgi:pyruvate,water dikinase